MQNKAQHTCKINLPGMHPKEQLALFIAFWNRTDAIALHQQRLLNKRFTSSCRDLDTVAHFTYPCHGAVPRRVALAEIAAGDPNCIGW